MSTRAKTFYHNLKMMSHGEENQILKFISQEIAEIFRGNEWLREALQGKGAEGRKTATAIGTNGS